MSFFLIKLIIGSFSFLSIKKLQIDTAFNLHYNTLEMIRQSLTLKMSIDSTGLTQVL